MIMKAFQISKERLELFNDTRKTGKWCGEKYLYKIKQNPDGLF